MEWQALQPYIGLRYEEDFDCADFVVHVARNLFGFDVTLPGDRPRGKGCEAVLAEASKAYATPTLEPDTGDLVLMWDFGDTIAPTHVGIYVSLGGIPYVLHSGRRLGGSVLTEKRKLARLGLTIEGYYKWLLP